MSKEIRQCGECEVCCISLDVPDIQKKAGVPCHLLNKKGYGCSIHNSSLQADVCRTWQCLWKKGIGDVGDRPDNIDVISYITIHDNICIQETKKGAIEKNPKALEAALKLCDITGRCGQIIYKGGVKTLVVPQKNKKLYRDFGKVVNEFHERADNESQ